MSKVKKVIALVLVVALCVSLLSTLAFAEITPTIDPENPATPKPYSVLFFGDKSLGFENDEGKNESYTQGFVDFVQKTVGTGYAVKGYWANEEFPGLRNSDLFAAIRPNVNDPMFTVFGLDNPATTKDGYYTQQFAGKDVQEEGAKMIQLQNFLDQFELGTLETALGTLDIDDRYPSDSVKAIVLDLTHNDLTNYLLARVTDVLNEYAKYVKDAAKAEEEGKTIGPFTYENGTYSGSITDLPAQFTREINLFLEVVMAAVGKALNVTMYPGLENQLRAAIEYTFVNFCLGFTETTLALKYWYPTAKLIVVGASNELDGVKVVIPNTPLLPQPKEEEETKDDKELEKENDVKTEEKAPAPVTIDLGAIYETMANMANAYITNFSNKYGINNTYFYANTDELGGVETIYQAADNSDKASESGKAAYDAFEDAIARDIADRLSIELNNELKNFVALAYDKGFINEAQAVGIETFGDFYNELKVNDIVGFVKTYTKLPANVIKAYNEEKFDLTGLVKMIGSIENMNDFSLSLFIGKALSDCMWKDSGLTDTEVALLALYGLTLDEGYVLYPSMNGQGKKLDAVNKAFLKILPANRDGEDAVGNLFIDGIIGVLNVFKSDILNALQTIFSPDFFGNFFARISNFFSGFFDGKIEFGDGKLF